MNKFQIFKAGTYTSMSGHKLEFSDKDIQDIVKSYNPSLHEAPIVIGHPKHNLPAYGWINGLSQNNGVIEAEPHQVNPEFSDMVQANAFKKRSAAFYSPNDANNPTPGAYYLRHVGFLGAAPPAVKGLKDIEFAEDDMVVIEFSDFTDDITDKSSLTKREDNNMTTKVEVDFQAQFSELNTKYEKLETGFAELALENKNFKAKEIEFSDKEKALLQREADIAKKEQKIERMGVEARVDQAVKAGRVLPAQRGNTVAFAMSLSDVNEIEFSEGGNKESICQREAYLRQLETSKPVIEFSEIGKSDGLGTDTNLDAADLAKKARQLVKDSDGTLNYADAVSQAILEIQS